MLVMSEHVHLPCGKHWAGCKECGGEEVTSGSQSVGDTCMPTHLCPKRGYLVTVVHGAQEEPGQVYLQIVQGL